MRYLALILLMGFPAAAIACPPGPYNAPGRASVMAALKVAKTPREAANLMGELRMIEMRAPDAETQAMLNAAHAQRNQGDVAASIDTLSALIRACPAFTEAYNQRAFSEFLVHRDAAALKDANHVLAKEPDHIGALAGKAMVLMRMGRIKEAKATIRTALKLDPWLPERKLLDAPEAPAAPKTKGGGNL